MAATTDPEGFTRWALDPARTRDEQVALESFLHTAQNFHRPEERDAFESPAFQARWQRFTSWRENPRQSPVVNPLLVERTARVLGAINSLMIASWGEGGLSMRDLGFIRFLPALESLRLDAHAPLNETMAVQLAEAPCAGGTLRVLHVHSEMEQWPALAGLQALEEMYIRSAVPWPGLGGLERLPRLRKLAWHGHSGAFLDVPSLPALEWFHFVCGSPVAAAESLRDFRLLPEMPALDLFWGGPMWRLDGVAQRCPRLSQLGVCGHFRTLEPLEGLERLTHLRLYSQETRRLEPVVTLPRVRQFVFLSRRPQDFTPLLEAPALQELHAYGCPSPQPDIAMVQHVLPAWEGHFTAAAPRPAGPLRLRVIPRRNKLAPTLPPGAWPDGPDGWEGNLLMRESECLWARQQIDAALEAAGLHEIRGIPKLRSRHKETLDKLENASTELLAFCASLVWLDLPPAEAPCRVELEIGGMDAISRLRRIIDTARPVLARLRIPMQFAICSRPYLADLDDPAWRRGRPTPEERIREEIQEDADRERRALREQEKMETELRERLAAEAGLPVTAPAPVRPRDEPGSGGGDEARPGREKKDEQWLPPTPTFRPAVNWEALQYFDLTLDGDDLWLDASGWGRLQKIEGLEYLLDLPAELAPGEVREVQEDE